ncbi:MAG: hypothetical protein K2K05_01155, partial [Muribaculaceae bacterium]|nr:hypothetical protein [Muribaculaceae bacterium]
MKENIKSPALGCKVGRAYQMMQNQLAQALKDAGLDLTTSEYLVMRAVFSNPGAQQCEIADILHQRKAYSGRCHSLHKIPAHDAYLSSTGIPPNPHE